MKTLFQYIAANPDYIVLACSSAFLVSYFIRWVIRNNNNSDDDDSGGGGGSNNGIDDPVLDLPPGVCLPRDKNEPELV